MCIIIDANVCSRLTSKTIDALPVVRRVNSGRLTVVAGGELKREHLKSSAIGLFLEWSRSGKMIYIPDIVVQKEVAIINGMEHCSNDLHIIALARAAGARILYSNDRNLHADFKNKELIGDGNGKIYQIKEHEHVLDEHVCECSKGNH